MLLCIELGWLFSFPHRSVSLHMSPQRTRSGEGKVTLVAFIWFFSTVCFKMPHQIACLRRGIVTLVAFVWLGDIVSLLLQILYICILETNANVIVVLFLFHGQFESCCLQMVASNWAKSMIFWFPIIKFFGQLSLFLYAKAKHHMRQLRNRCLAFQHVVIARFQKSSWIPEV